MRDRPINPWIAALCLLYLVGIIAALWWGVGLDRELPCSGRAACSTGAAR